MDFFNNGNLTSQGAGVISGGLGVLGGVFGAIGAGKQRREAKGIAEGQLDTFQTMGDTARQQLEQTKYDLSPTMRRMLDAAKADPTADAERARQLRVESQTVNALKQTGPKGAAALGNILQSQADAAAGIEARSFNRLQQALQTVGAAEQTVMDKNIAAERELAGIDYGQALAGQQSAQEAINQAQIQQAGAGWTAAGQITSGLGDIAGAFMAEDGAKVQETPGPFSHKINPIDIMRDGAKIGEMTGGETILNPEQTGKIETLASKGNSDLHRYVRKLFAKFDREQ